MPGVSSTHTELTATESGKVYLTHLAPVTAGPTVVNGDVVQDTVCLAHDDIIQIGERIFRFEYIITKITPPMNRKAYASKTSTREKWPMRDVANVLAGETAFSLTEHKYSHQKETSCVFDNAAVACAPLSYTSDVRNDCRETTPGALHSVQLSSFQSNPPPPPPPPFSQASEKRHGSQGQPKNDSVSGSTNAASQNQQTDLEDVQMMMEELQVSM
jgi:hypothetical protein